MLDAPVVEKAKADRGPNLEADRSLRVCRSKQIHYQILKQGQGRWLVNRGVISGTTPRHKHRLAPLDVRIEKANANSLIYPAFVIICVCGAGALTWCRCFVHLSNCTFALLNVKLLHKVPDKIRRAIGSHDSVTQFRPCVFQRSNCTPALLNA